MTCIKLNDQNHFLQMQRGNIIIKLENVQIHLLLWALKNCRLYYLCLSKLCSIPPLCLSFRSPALPAARCLLAQCLHLLELGALPVKPMGFSAGFLFAVLVLACEVHLQQLRGEQRSVASFRGHGMSCLLCR